MWLRGLSWACMAGWLISDANSWEDFKEGQLMPGAMGSIFRPTSGRGQSIGWTSSMQCLFTATCSHGLVELPHGMVASSERASESQRT